MAFTPRQFAQILADSLNYVTSHTDLTDEEVGSAIRSVLEAAALEDDEIYFQMVQLLDAFNIRKNSGVNLARRLNEFDIDKLPAKSSSGKVVFKDLALIKTTLRSSVTVGSVALDVADVSEFPTSGFNYTVRVGEGTINVEDVDCSAVDTISNSLTISALVNDHPIGDRVSFVSGSADQTIASGQLVQVPAVGDDSPIKFVTIERGSLVNGNFQSTPVRARALLSGTIGNVGPGQISEFTGSQPFTGAGVTNVGRFGGGKEVESDSELKNRAFGQIQSLSRAILLSLTQAVKGVTDPVTNQSITSANAIEDLENDEVIVYIDDGTGFTPDTVSMARSEILADILAGESTITVITGGSLDFPAEGYLLLSPEDIGQTELVQYTDVNYTTGVFTLVSATVNPHDGGDEVVLVDPLNLAAEAGTNFFSTSNLPIVRDSQRLWVKQGVSNFALQEEDVDYYFNRGTGQIQIAGSGVQADAQVLMSYTYYTGLVATAQKVLDGAIEDPVNFQGYRAAGIKTFIETPSIRRIRIKVVTSVDNGFFKDQVNLEVQNVIETYISSRGIGVDIILAKITELAMLVPGMKNMTISYPHSDVVIFENELPVPFTSTGTSLVSVR